MCASTGRAAGAEAGPPDSSPALWPNSVGARLVDLIGASLLLLFASIPMLLISVVLLVTQGRPVIFRQQRIGQGGEAFTLHKFRTLPRHAERESLVTPKPSSACSLFAGFLRTTHLDELPQLFDVLRGRMSLVGPRPLVAALLTGATDASLRDALSVRPGMTSGVALDFICEDEVLAQVDEPESAYRDVLIPARIRLEAMAQPGRSLAGDLVTLAMTSGVVFTRGRSRRCQRRVTKVLNEKGYL